MSVTNELKPESVVKCSEDQVSCDLDGETVLMSIQNGMYYGMDAIASRIWELIQTPQSVQQVCDSLQSEYEVPSEQCEKDVLTFLSALTDEGLIEVEAAHT